MFILTLVLGFVALIALAMPDLVLLGLFLIVPGIILMVAPTAFVYMASATLASSTTHRNQGDRVCVLRHWTTRIFGRQPISLDG